MKALVGAFNQEKALVGAFSVIVQPVVEPMDRFIALFNTLTSPPAQHWLPACHHLQGQEAAAPGPEDGPRGAGGEDQSQRGIWSRDPVLTSDWLDRCGVPGVPRQCGHPRHRRHVRHVSAGRGHAGQEALQVNISTNYWLKIYVFNRHIKQRW